MVFALPSIIGNADPKLGFGCVVDCGIARAGSGFQAVVPKVRLFIDTGADRTFIRGDVARRINLEVMSRDNRIVGHPLPVRLYTCDFWFAGTLLKSDFQIFELPLGLEQPNFDGLLGWDLLAASVFCLNGPARTFTLILD